MIPGWSGRPLCDVFCVFMPQFALALATVAVHDFFVYWLPRSPPSP